MGDDIQTREAFKKRCCVISTDGFYEWKGQKETKQPMFITLLDKLPFAFAGLWESWRNKQNPDVIYRSCMIITRDTTGPLRDLQRRMPVILDPGAYSPWLALGNHELDLLTAILQDHAVTDLAFYPVSRQVNAILNSDPSKIEPIQAHRPGD